MTNIKTAAILTTFIFVLSCTNNSNHKTNTVETTNQTDTLTEKEVPVQTEEEKITFNTYCNDRFGFCIDYPVDKLYPQGESGNGDGQIFKSKDAENTLWVYRDFRDNENPDETFQLESAFNYDSWGTNPDKPKRVITYKKLGKEFYVVSGYNNGKIFYQKTMLTDGQLVTALIEYNESEKDFYNKVSEQIFKSFK